MKTVTKNTLLLIVGTFAVATFLMLLTVTWRYL